MHPEKYTFNTLSNCHARPLSSTVKHHGSTDRRHKYGKLTIHYSDDFRSGCRNVCKMASSPSLDDSHPADQITLSVTVILHDDTTV